MDSWFVSDKYNTNNYELSEPTSGGLLGRAFIHSSLKCMQPHATSKVVYSPTYKVLELLETVCLIC
jgi:hypothetical protein